MFCARCGKEIDNDSTFCPFCGQKTDEPVERGGGIPKPKVSVKMPDKKVVGGIVVAVVVLLIVFGISKVIGGISHRARSLPEKLFAMSWEERSELSEDDIKNMLKESGTLYDIQTEGSVNAFTTRTTESFMKGDCLFMTVPDVFEGIYAVRYETEEDFKEGRKLIESTLEKQLIKKMDVFESTSEGVQARYYPVGVSDKYLDRYLDQADLSAGIDTFDGVSDLYVDIDEDDDRIIDVDRIRETKDRYSIYKFVYVVYGTAYELGLSSDGGLTFPSDKSYTDQICIIGTLFVPACEESVISMLASLYNYDAISGEAMDINKFKESVDNRIVDVLLEEYAGDDSESRREWEKTFYSRLYMMENHKFDMISKTYIESKDEKRLWYIRNFNWDTDTDAPINLSDYRNSGSIYCAVECNYNSDATEYFESELDKALYLADRDYKAGTGERFESTEEKRLWFMQNYSYDTEAGEEIDKEVVDALIAYQKYIDDNYSYAIYEGKIGDGWCISLLYINEDNIPELLISSDVLANGNQLCIYSNGSVHGTYFRAGGGLSYFEKRNLIHISSGWGGEYANEVCKIEDSELKIVGSGLFSDYYEEDGGYTGEYSYSWNDAECSEEDYKNALDTAFYNAIDGLDPIDVQLGYTGVKKANILYAYDALRTTIYETYEYCIYEYELKDGILTVKADNGANKSSSFGEQTAFEFSCPVADECVWEGGNGFGEYRSESTYPMTPEEMEVEIKNWRNQYDLTPDYMESPVAIQFHVIGDRVVGVYTSTP